MNHNDYILEMEIVKLKKIIRQRLTEASNKIVEEEILNILGRVKIFRSVNLKEDHYSWTIEAIKKDDQ